MLSSTVDGGGWGLFRRSKYRSRAAPKNTSHIQSFPNTPGVFVELDVITLIGLCTSYTDAEKPPRWRRGLGKHKKGGWNSWGPLKAETGTCCLDGGALQQCWPSEAPSTPSINWQALKEPSLNSSLCSWLDWQLLEVGEQHRAMDGWLASNWSVCDLSFPLKFTTGSGVQKQKQQLNRGGKKNYYITLLGSAVKLTATWVHIIHCSVFFPMEDTSHLITYHFIANPSCPCREQHRVLCRVYLLFSIKSKVVKHWLYTDYKCHNI